MLEPRVRLLLAVVTGFAVVAVAGVWIATAHDDRPAASALNGARRPPGARVPPLTGLRDQDGRAVRMPREASVITFVSSKCATTCFALMQTIRGALDDVGTDVPVLAVSVDPARDTPRRARRFLREQRMTGRARFLLGPERVLRRVWDAYGIQPRARGSHSSYLVLTQGGEQKLGYPITGLSPEALASDLRMLRRSEW